MAIQASGEITLSDIQAEFGGSNPVGLSEYYRGGAYVPSTAPTANIPSAGAISLSDFYGAANVPAASATLKWAGNIANGQTLDVSAFATTPYSTLVVIQRYSTGSEIFYWMPSPKMDGTRMDMVDSVYSNALDDGRGITVSMAPVASGGSHTLTWTIGQATESGYPNPGRTSGVTGTGYVYEVLGFRDMYAALHATSYANDLSSRNRTIPTSLSINVPSNGLVIMAGADGITGSLFDVTDARPYTGIDLNPASGTQTYTGGNRLLMLSSYNLDLA
jgi:hypothetical protein